MPYISVWSTIGNQDHPPIITPSLWTCSLWPMAGASHTARGGVWAVCGTVKYDASCTIKHSTNSELLPCSENNWDVVKKVVDDEPLANFNVNRP